MMWNSDILQNKTALITGASAGIGFACARELGALGAEVVINGRDAARLDAATEALKRALPQARFRPVVADVGSAGGVAALLAEADEIDIPINNVGFMASILFWKRRTLPGSAISTSISCLASG